MPPAPPSIATVCTASNNSAPTSRALNQDRESNMTASSTNERLSELNSKVTAYGNKVSPNPVGTPGNTADNVDRALSMLAANNEILAHKGTRNMP